MSNVFEVESVCRPAVQPGKFYLSGISTEVVCHFGQVGWFAGNVIMIMARFNSGIFWLCIRKKKHLEVFKFDFEKNEMPNVSSVESSVDARSTLWESTRWCLLKVIPAFWCLKVLTCSSFQYIDVWIVYLSIYLPTYLSTYLSICLSVCLSIHLSIHPSIYPSIDLSVCLSIYLSIYPSIHLSIYLSIYLIYLSTILSFYHSIILSFYHSIILSFYHSIILSFYHSIILFYLSIYLSIYIIIRFYLSIYLIILFYSIPFHSILFYSIYSI